MTEGYFERTMREWGKTLDEFYEGILKTVGALSEKDIRKAMSEKGYKVKDINRFLRQIKKLRETTHG